jgi:dTDP-4-amino-4,6-dideoxygalactose transaminase
VSNSEGLDTIRDEPLDFASPTIGKREIERIVETLESGWLTTGQRTEAFESRIAEYVRASHAIGTTNCSSALYLAMRALDLTGEVITTPLTFATTVSSMIMAGATPILADVREDTLTLDIDAVREQITKNTEAIVPVHYAGQGMDVDPLLDLAEDNDLRIIEDAAHGIGGSYEGEHLGTLGDIGCFSFYATKNITTGEGGMAVTDDDGIGRKIRQLRLAGVDRDAWERETDRERDWYYDVVDVSSKFNMNDLQASLGIAQFERLDEFIEQRRKVADYIDDAFDDVSGVRPLEVRDASEHARHLYPVRIDPESTGTTRDEVVDALDSADIGTSVHYIPIHYHSAFREIDRGNLSNVERAYERIVCLPLHPDMDESDADDVVTAVTQVVA